MRLSVRNEHLIFQIIRFSGKRYSRESNPFSNSFVKIVFLCIFFFFLVCNYHCNIVVKQLVRLFYGKIFKFKQGFDLNKYFLTVQKCFSLLFQQTITFSKSAMRKTRKRSEICSELTIKTPERCLTSFWCFIVTLNIFHIFFQCFYC